MSILCAFFPVVVAVSSYEHNDFFSLSPHHIFIHILSSLKFSILFKEIYKYDMRVCAMFTNLYHSMTL